MTPTEAADATTPDPTGLSKPPEEPAVVLTLPEVPFALHPSRQAAWRLTSTGLEALAGPETEYFIDPGYTEIPDEYTRLNADTLLGDLPEGDFQLAARVEVESAATYDAGVLLVQVGERTWAKLCLERSPAGIPTVVSVVAQGSSDDANAFEVPAGVAWLRIARLGRVLAFHASLDGQQWRMVRVFTFGAHSQGTRIGFLAQSPQGQGCRVMFADVLFRPEAPAEIRDGA